MTTTSNNSTTTGDVNNHQQTTAPQASRTEVDTPIDLQTGTLDLVSTRTIVGVPTVVPYRASQRDSADNLVNFFERPRAIYTYTWGTASGVATFDPWALYLAATTVQKKMATFMGFRGTLHVACLLSTQPQLYGGLRLQYLPWTAGLGLTGALTPQAYLPYPPQHAYINAALPAGVEFILPFFYNTPYMPVVPHSVLSYFSVVPVATIARADGVAPGNVDVQFYAWMTGVQFTGASVTYQSEYSSSPISGPATAVASLASKLTSVPFIGPFARATEIGASAVSAIAKLFGFSRPADIENRIVTHPRSVGRLAVTSGLDPVDKLSTDPKCELSIAPQTVGLPGTEISMIRDMAKNESFLVSIPWATTDATNAFLQQWVVSPTLLPSGSTSHTHLSYATLPFSLWTGSLIYRFRVFCSPFQRGRLFIIYDPSHGLDPLSPLMSAYSPDTLIGTNHFCVLDISSDTDVDFVVGHGQLRAYNQVVTMPYATTPDAFHAHAINGMLAVFVDSPLLSPAASAIQIIVTVRAGDDFTVAKPSNVEYGENFWYSELVSTEAAGNTSCAPKTCVLNATVVDKEALALSYTGEQIISARAMSKRYSLIGTCDLNATALGAAATVQWRVNRWRINQHPHPNYALGSFSGYTTSADTAWVFPSYMRWWANTHAGYRGSTRYKIVHNIPTAQRCTVVITRVNEPFNIGWAIQPTVVDNDYPGTLTQVALRGLDETSNGAIIMDAHQAGGIEFELPWYSNKLFLPIKGSTTPSTTIFDHPQMFDVTFVGTDWNAQRFYFQLYEAAGEDFTPFYYIGPPSACSDTVPLVTWAQVPS